MARISVADGSATLFPLFDKDLFALGVTDIFSTGIAISPLNPTIAVVTGFEVPRGARRLIWKVHLATGTVLGPALELQDEDRNLVLHALDFSLDGSTLYGINSDEELVTVDPDTGVVTVLGATGVQSPFMEGLAFRPEDGTLFAATGPRHVDGPSATTARPLPKIDRPWDGPWESVAPPATDPMPRATTREAQRLLTGLGYRPGLSDGVARVRTRAAVRAFQRDHGMADHGRLTRRVMDRLRRSWRRAAIAL